MLLPCPIVYCSTFSSLLLCRVFSRFRLSLSAFTTSVVRILLHFLEPELAYSSQRRGIRRKESAEQCCFGNGRRVTPALQKEEGMDMLKPPNRRSVVSGRSKLQQHLAKRCQFVVEALERRTLLSVAGLTATPTFVVDGPAPTGMASSSDLNPSATLSAPFSPAQIAQPYGAGNIAFNGITGNGTGQTIAIVDAYNDPGLIGDTATFNTRFNLPQFNVSGGPTLKVLS